MAPLHRWARQSVKSGKNRLVTFLGGDVVASRARRRSAINKATQRRVRRIIGEITRWSLIEIKRLAIY